MTLPIILSRLLLVALLLVNLEGFANLENSSAVHDDSVIHFHEDDDSLSVPGSTSGNVPGTDDDGHCSHCFHHHSSGVLAQTSHFFVVDRKAHKMNRSIHFDSAPASPPIPPPNI